MSSTNRGRDRHVSDYYITPQEYIRTLLGHFLVDEGIDRPDRVLWLDPCAGGAADHVMSYPTVLEEEFGATVYTADVREDSPAMMTGDYVDIALADHHVPPPHVVITNPPFYQSEAIIEKALADVRDGGYVVMLHRINFLGGQKKMKPGGFWRRNQASLKRVYLHPDRISFTSDGKTDSTKYAHFVWQRGYDGPSTIEVTGFSQPHLTYLNQQ